MFEIRKRIPGEKVIARRDDLAPGWGFGMGEYEGTVVTISDEPTSTVDRNIGKEYIYHIKEDGGEYWWSESMFEEIPEISQFDIPAGSIAKTKEHTYIVFSDKFSASIDEPSTMSTIITKNMHDPVLKIYDIRNMECHSFNKIKNASDESLVCMGARLIWRRKDIKEMTVAEIEEKLGYRIKVVKE